MGGRAQRLPPRCIADDRDGGLCSETVVVVVVVVIVVVVVVVVVFVVVVVVVVAVVVFVVAVGAGAGGSCVGGVRGGKLKNQKSWRGVGGEGAAPPPQMHR